MGFFFSCFALTGDFFLHFFLSSGRLRGWTYLVDCVGGLIWSLICFSSVAEDGDAVGSGKAFGETAIMETIPPLLTMPHSRRRETHTSVLVVVRRVTRMGTGGNPGQIWLGG
jgi:hypothetical protein